VCEARDTNDLYARARAGLIGNVTGIDHPFEAPAAPDLRLDTAQTDIATNLRTLLAALVTRGWAPA